MKSPIKYWLVWETRQVPLSEGTSILGRAPDAEVHYRTSDDVGAKLGRQVARFVVKHALKPE
jgi:hypothetical protein